MSSIVEASGLGKRYGLKWALRDCTINIPKGKIVGLIGPNGAGKSTFLNLAAGVILPSAGRIHVDGRTPGSSGTHLNEIGFVGQDNPVYKHMSLRNHLRMGAWLNPRWDASAAEQRLKLLGLNPKQLAGSLSGGQRAQLSLVLATAKLPTVLLLDEPVASLDPLARREFLQTLMEMFSDSPMSIVLSSHNIEDVDRICDYLVVLIDSRVQLCGETSDILQMHTRLSGPRCDTSTLHSAHEVIEETHTDRQTTVIVRTTERVLDPRWIATPVTLEDVALAYMKRAASNRPSRNDDGATSTTSLKAVK
jgi:ABC-2 type transport system ATP-binding protein